MIMSVKCLMVKSLSLLLHAAVCGEVFGEWRGGREGGIRGQMGPRLHTVSRSVPLSEGFPLSPCTVEPLIRDPLR